MPDPRRGRGSTWSRRRSRTFYCGARKRSSLRQYRHPAFTSVDTCQIESSVLQLIRIRGSLNSAERRFSRSLHRRPPPGITWPERQPLRRVDLAAKERRENPPPLPAPERVLSLPERLRPSSSARPRSDQRRVPASNREPSARCSRARSHCRSRLPAAGTTRRVVRREAVLFSAPWARACSLHPRALPRASTRPALRVFVAADRC